MTTNYSFFFIIVVYEEKDQSNNAECQDDADQHATYICSNIITIISIATLSNMQHSDPH